MILLVRHIQLDVLGEELGGDRIRSKDKLNQRITSCVELFFGSYPDQRVDIGLAVLVEDGCVCGVGLCFPSVVE